MSDWRVEKIDEVRGLIRDAVPGVVEESKWKKASNPDGVPAFSKDGLICTAETYKDKVKLTFADGGALDDPAGLFNAGTGKRRAIDLQESDALDAEAFKALVRAAAEHNAA